MTNEIKQRIEQINRGEVPHGYKKTAVGIVPQEWESDKTFGDIFEFFRGLGIARDGLGDKGVPYLHYGDMHKNTFTKVSYSQYLNLPKYDTEINGTETFLLNDGDVVFLDASEDLSGTSKCVMVDNPENKPYISGLHTFCAKSKNNYLVKDFKQFITSSQSTKKQFKKLASGFKVYGLNRNSIKSVITPYPKDEKEQQRIADILSTWDEAVSLQEKLIEKLELQKKALMQKLLTPKEGWKKVKLGKLAFMQSGGTPKSTVDEYYNGDIIWVSINDITSSDKYLTNSERKLTKKGLDNSSARIFTAGTLLYAMYASIGKCCIATKECSTSQAILGITPHNDLDTEYLYYYLTCNRDKIVLQGQKGTQSNLNKEMVQGIVLNLPKTKDEQVSISNKLKKFDIYINLQAQKLTKLKQQQKAMQQLLLTGIVRV